MALKPGQAKCIQTLDRSLVVAAGAGSGKTFTLTKRIVHAIETGAVDGVERVCAITFTNKAAGELKSRIKAELRACGRADEALKVDEAWVSTIHGMCARILRAHALELDIDPAFAMADSTVANRLRDIAVDKVLRDAQAGAPESGPLPSQDALDRLFAEYPARSYGLRSASVESMLADLIDAAGANVRGFDSFIVSGGNVNCAALVVAVLDALEGLAEQAGGQKPNEAREAWIAATVERIGEIRAALDEGRGRDPLDAMRLIDSLPHPKKVGTADYKAHVAAALDLSRMCVLELRLAAASEHLEVLVALAKRAFELFIAAKRSEGILDNNDLLVRAFDAIENHSAIARRYADKFQLVMVDEFQDTDQMQVDMIKRLAGPGSCRLCTVGDAQQSIYRFRGADVSVYRRHLDEVRSKSPDDVIMLPDNFRSHADVLSLVDRVFERSAMFGGEFMSLAPGRDESQVKHPFAEGHPRIEVQLTSNEYRGVSADSVRRVAAARIAEAFARLVEEGHSAGEMAVLLGGMTHAAVYASALRARNLACVISGGSVFAGTPEAAVMLDLARVLSNPYRTQPLHNVLTSPMFDLGPDDLLVLATGKDERDGSLERRNLWKGLSLCARMLQGRERACEQGHVRARPHPRAQKPADDRLEGLSSRLALAATVMDGALSSVGRSSIARIMARVVSESGWLSRLEAQGAEGLASAGNVYKAIRMVESIERSAAVGPACVARQFESALRDSKEAPGALSATGGDFVRIMTVHASKGLEFPIVAVAEFKDGRPASSGLIAGEVDGNVYLSLDLQASLSSLSGLAQIKDVGAVFSSMMEEEADEDELTERVRQATGALELRSALYERDRVGDEEEAKRLLYVALTRAKEALVISLMGKRTKDNPYASPRSCLGALVPALAGEQGVFEEGRSLLDFGGTAPALVEHIALRDGDELDEGAGDAADCEPVAFAVPNPETKPIVRRVPYSSAHEGIFSYSSIAKASHEGPMLDRLAEKHCVAIDDGCEQAAYSLFLRPSEDAGGEGACASWQYRANALDVDEDDGSWAYGGASCDDADKATDLGTAFHRLAQYAVVERSDGTLRLPDEARCQALSRACGLDEVQRQRLDEALGRWFASDVAEFMGSLPDLRAEVPFFVEVPGGRSRSEERVDAGSRCFLEGEIDLLGFDETRGCAYVVDYKTGGRDDETREDLGLKHVMQASCYAYAIMLQGVPQVEATFVRVERRRAGSPSQPQRVVYRFDASDLPALASVLSEVHGASQTMKGNCL